MSLKLDNLKELNKSIINTFADKDIVLGDGEENSKLMLIGEAPGKKEVDLRKPFVGQAGKQLNEFLDKLELERRDLYITNVVKFRPTRESKKTGRNVNRPPSIKEVNSFAKFLFQEIQIINPKIIVTLGNVPLKTVLENRKIKIGEVHGELLKKQINNCNYNVVPLYHPAAVIYRRNLKEIYIEDLEKLKNILKRY